MNERLEEIKEEYEWNVENELLPRTSDDNFEWLIEQVKTLQKLKKVMKKDYAFFDKINNELEEVKEDNKRYREAITKAIAHFNQDEHVEGMIELRKVLEVEK